LLSLWLGVRQALLAGDNLLDQATQYMATAMLTECAQAEAAAAAVRCAPILFHSLSFSTRHSGTATATHRLCGKKLHTRSQPYCLCSLLVDRNHEKSTAPSHRFAAEAPAAGSQTHTRSKYQATTSMGPSKNSTQPPILLVGWRGDMKTRVLRLAIAMVDGAEPVWRQPHKGEGCPGYSLLCLR
jgi:hypothetical protein